MQCRYINESVEQTAAISLGLEETRVVGFQTHFEGSMEMYSDVETVANYLNAHEDWFCRCAEPMKTEPIGDNGYILVIGQYGAFGYEVEPKMAVVLEPAVEGVYKMYSIPIPNEPYLGYQVDYQASMQLTEMPATVAAKSITKVKWQLHLTVAVSFPKFIYRLPMTMIQKTGDRLLSQIIRQVSPRLTYKVQQAFHDSLGLPMPPKSSRQLYQIDSMEGEEEAVA